MTVSLLKNKELSKDKELSPEEIQENIKEITKYLSTLPKDLLQKYKESTGQDNIIIFKNTRTEKGKYDQMDKLTATISPDNKLDLILNIFGQYETGTFRHLSTWDKNTYKEINDFETCIFSNNIGKTNIANYKKEIFTLGKILRNETRNHRIINPIKNALTSVLKTKKTGN